MQSLVTNVHRSEYVSADGHDTKQLPQTYKSAKMRRFVLLIAGIAAVAMAGCGGSSKDTASKADFSLEVAPSAITVTPGGAPQTLTVGTTPTSGFAGSVSVAIGTLPAGTNGAGRRNHRPGSKSASGLGVERIQTS